THETEPHEVAAMVHDMAVIHLVGMIGPRVRLAWHRHACDRPAEALAKLTHAELTSLEESLDDELCRISTRLGAVQAASKATIPAPVSEVPNIRNSQKEPRCPWPRNSPAEQSPSTVRSTTPPRP